MNSPPEHIKILSKYEHKLKDKKVAMKKIKRF